MYNLFLDDIRTPMTCDHMANASFYRTNEWLVARNYNEFVGIIEDQWFNGNFWPGLISFDHDLADVHYTDSFITEDQYDETYVGLAEKTGMDCAKWLADFCMEQGLEFPKIMIHSQNTVGAKNIQSFVESFRRHQKNEKL